MVRAKRSGIIRRKARSRIAKLTVEGKFNTVIFVTNNKKFYGIFWLHRALKALYEVPVNENVELNILNLTHKSLYDGTFPEYLKLNLHKVSA